MEKEEKIKKSRHFLFQPKVVVTLVSLICLIIVLCRFRAKPTIVFAGTSKNIPVEQIRGIVRKLSVVGEELFSDYHFVIYDNDSPMIQQRAWREALGNRGTFVSERSDRRFRVRTERMAYARNKLLDLIHGSDYSKFDYLWLQDLDGTCGGPHGKDSYSLDVFRRVFEQSDKWDVVTFIFLPYWDLWGFRHPILFPYNMYGRYAVSNPPRGSVQKFLESKMKGPVDSEFIDVDSAFMMTAIHKMWTTTLSRYKHLDDNGDADCEHVAFYKEMKKRGVKVRLWPVVFCEGDPGFVSV